MRRSGVFTTVFAVTKIEALEVALDFKANRAAEAGTVVFIGH
jgi:hypothetical protein